MGLECQHIRTIYEGAPADLKRAQTTIADQPRDSLPRDVAQARGFGLGNPV